MPNKIMQTMHPNNCSRDSRFLYDTVYNFYDMYGRLQVKWKGECLKTHGNWFTYKYLFYFLSFDSNWMYLRFNCTQQHNILKFCVSYSLIADGYFLTSSDYLH